MTTPVLFVNHEPGLGGAELSLLDLLSGLDRKRFTPLVATSADGPLAERVRRLGGEVALVPMTGTNPWRKARAICAAGPELARHVRARGVGLLHANSLLGGYAASLAAWRTGVPLVWHVRDIGYPWLGRLLCRRADRVLANSAATAAALGAEASRTVIVHNGIPERFFTAVPPPRPERTTAPRIGMVGRLDPWKGHTEFLAAAASLLPDHPGLEVWIAGGQPVAGSQAHADYPRHLAELAEREGLRGHVRFLGHVDDVIGVLDQLDVYVHPSRAPEPFGRAVVEAMARARPIVATRAGGIPELVEHGVTGLLVPPGDPGALATAIAQLLRDRGLAQDLAGRARQAASAKFTIARHVAVVERVYADLLSRPRPG